MIPLGTDAMLRGGAWDDLPAWDPKSGWSAGAVSNGGRSGNATLTRVGVSGGHLSENHDYNNATSPSRPIAPEDQRAAGAVDGPPPLTTINGTLRDLCERIRDRIRDLQGEWANTFLWPQPTRAKKIKNS